ncbi:hypothetical protein R1flu_023828 [Riccia fluitans]|uniref:Uncharacterized protein n=1 Tax=Riccia fluitans TaxID=41844 RepID=A0ABD1XW36_9MARC
MECSYAESTQSEKHPENNEGNIVPEQWSSVVAFHYAHMHFHRSVPSRRSSKLLWSFRDFLLGILGYLRFSR